MSKLKLAMAMITQELTFVELSKKSNVSRATLSYINNGKTCSDAVAIKIAKALNIEVTDLLEEN